MAVCPLCDKAFVPDAAESGARALFCEQCRERFPKRSKTSDSPASTGPEDRTWIISEVATTSVGTHTAWELRNQIVDKLKQLDPVDAFAVANWLEGRLQFIQRGLTQRHFSAIEKARLQVPPLGFPGRMFEATVAEALWEDERDQRKEDDEEFFGDGQRTVDEEFDDQSAVE